MILRASAPLAMLLAAAIGIGARDSSPPLGTAAAPARGIRLVDVAGGFDHPVDLAAPAGDARLFVVEQKGVIRIVENGRVLPEPFLDLEDRVSDGGERGLLSVAFHPRYAENGYFYVDYTDRRGDTRVERYSVSADRNRADPASAHRILGVFQPYANHNGGEVRFGPDGMLYVGLGDGGSEGDPDRTSQNRSTLLGKLLRIDVDHGDPYAIPPDNPFRGRRDARPEIWALGLRNPWRFCFDRVSGLLYIADVGQNQWEEIDVAPGRKAGLNYGWSIMEGTHCYRDKNCDHQGLTLPALEYDHARGCSITGGFVYRGRNRALQGNYFFSDYCEGWIESIRYQRGHATLWRRWELPERFAVSSFGEDGEGELYVVAYEGRILRIVSGS